MRYGGSRKDRTLLLGGTVRAAAREPIFAEPRRVGWGEAGEAAAPLCVAALHMWTATPPRVSSASVRPRDEVTDAAPLASVLLRASDNTTYHTVNLSESSRFAERGPKVDTRFFARTCRTARAPGPGWAQWADRLIGAQVAPAPRNTVQSPLTLK